MKDHYVAQTYLEAFTNSKGLLIPYYKRRNIVIGKAKSPKAVCYEINGDANKYFNDIRILDKYLPQFENFWKKNVEHLRQYYLDDIIKYQISGYLAFLRVCTPAAKRLGQERIQAAMQPTVQSFVEHQFSVNPPLDKETKEIVESLIKEKQITTKIDRQFPHALGISQLQSISACFLNSVWLIMINNKSHPFITSDNPAVTYYHGRDASMSHIYVPLAPDIALLITNGINAKSISSGNANSSASSEDRFAVPKDAFIKTFNELIIQTAENSVFHSEADRSLEQKIKKNANWCMTISVDKIPTEKGIFIITRELPREERGNISI